MLTALSFSQAFHFVLYAVVGVLGTMVATARKPGTPGVPIPATPVSPINTAALELEKIALDAMAKKYPALAAFEGGIQDYLAQHQADIIDRVVKQFVPQPAKSAA